MEQAVRAALAILEQVVLQKGDRSSLVNQFICHVQSVPPEIPNVGALEILAELSIDLDYYVENPRFRREDPSFYGDDVLIDVIGKAAQRLREIGTDLPNALRLLSS